MKKLFTLIKHQLALLWSKIIEADYKKYVMELLIHLGNFFHRAIFDVLLPKRLRSLTKYEIYTIIFKSDTPRGKKFDVWLLILISLNIITIMLESMTGAAHWFVVLMRVFGWLFTIIFTLEFYLRIYCVSHPKVYLKSFYGIIDIISIFPPYLSIFFPAATTLSVLRLMRVMRVFRIYKMEQFIDEGKFLIAALRRSAVKIVVFMLFVFVVAIILGAAMYGIEGSKNPDISSIPRGVYWAVVTITTVGYGDITPVTSVGQFISMVVMLLGYSIIAVPTGIVAGETIEEHKQQRERRRKKKNKRIQAMAPEPDFEEQTPVNIPYEYDPAVDATPEDMK
ncbi:MAG: ion transporter [Bacteroidales bacterium]|nr:ion transporter [Bacteroidales bacterium]